MDEVISISDFLCIVFIIALAMLYLYIKEKPLRENTQKVEFFLKSNSDTHFTLKFSTVIGIAEVFRTGRVFQYFEYEIILDNIVCNYHLPYTGGLSAPDLNFTGAQLLQALYNQPASSNALWVSHNN